MVRRRRKLNGRCLSSSLAVVYRDLERRELWDVTAIQAFRRCVADFLHRTREPSEALLKDIRRKLRQGVTCGRHLLAGALTAALCKTVVAPVERVRMDIILSNSPYGPRGTCLQIIQNEGIGGFWRGNLLNIIRTAPFKAVNFFAFDVYCKAFQGLSQKEETNDAERYAAGALAGVTALLACLPLDTIRTRLLSTRSVHQYDNIIHAFNEIVRTEGVSALYKGCVPGLLSIAPGSAVFYGVYGTLKQRHLKCDSQGAGWTELRNCVHVMRLPVVGEGHREGSRMELPVLHSLLYGAIAGMCAELVVYPLEVIRRQVQLQTNAIAISNSIAIRNGVGASLQSFSSACGTIIRTQGPGGFYAGCLLNTAQVLPSAALSYFTYEALKALLRVEASTVETDSDSN